MYRGGRGRGRHDRGGFGGRGRERGRGERNGMTPPNQQICQKRHLGRDDGDRGRNDGGRDRRRDVEFGKGPGRGGGGRDNGRGRGRDGGRGYNNEANKRARIENGTQHNENNHKEENGGQYTQHEGYEGYEGYGGYDEFNYDYGDWSSWDNSGYYYDPYYWGVWAYGRVHTRNEDIRGCVGMPNADLGLVADLWLGWGFQMNFMYESVH